MQQQHHHQPSSYYEGTGIYQDFYDVAVSRYPQNPTKDNTTPSQNFLGIVAATYKAFHEDGTPPLDFIRQQIHRYQLDPVIYQLLKKILIHAKPANLTTTLNKLLDEAIYHDYFRKSMPNLIQKLELLYAFQNTLW